MVPIEHTLAGKPRFHGKSWMFAQCGRSSTFSLSVLAVDWKHFLKQSLWKTWDWQEPASQQSYCFLSVLAAAGVDILKESPCKRHFKSREPRKKILKAYTNCTHTVTHTVTNSHYLLDGHYLLDTPFFLATRKSLYFLCTSSCPAMPCCFRQTRVHVISFMWFRSRFQSPSSTIYGHSNILYSIS